VSYQYLGVCFASASAAVCCPRSFFSHLLVVCPSLVSFTVVATEYATNLQMLCRINEKARRYHFLCRIRTSFVMCEGKQASCLEILFYKNKGGIGVMEMVLKTKTVSEELGVNPTTVQRWVRHFNIQCDKNEHGHYLFRNEDLEQLREIKEQLDKGLLMSDIQIKSADNNFTAIKNNNLEDKFVRLDRAIDALEKKIEEKADAVVSYQMLQHASELEELIKKMEQMEARLQDIEVSLLKKNYTEETIYVKEKAKKNWFVSLFTL
jgi:chromosome-anchoring protein RacA